MIWWGYMIGAAGFFVGVVGLLMLYGGNWLMDWDSGDDGYTRRYIDFSGSAANAGKSYSEIRDELVLREAFARLRVDASNAVRANPGNWHAAYTRAVQDAFNRLSMSDPMLMPGLATMLRGLSYGHILYPEEARLVDEKLSGIWRIQPTDTQAAALKIVKPS